MNISATHERTRVDDGYSDILLTTIQYDRFANAQDEREWQSAFQFMWQAHGNRLAFDYVPRITSSGLVFVVIQRWIVPPESTIEILPNEDARLLVVDSGDSLVSCIDEMCKRRGNKYPKQWKVDKIDTDQLADQIGVWARPS